MTGKITKIGMDGKDEIFRTSGTVDKFSTFQKIVGEDLFNGISVGAVIGIAAKLAFQYSTPAVYFAWGAAAIGTAIGAITNYNTSQDIIDNGKEIKPPKRLNSGIIKGLVSGFSVGAGITMAIGSFFSIAAPLIATAAIPLAIGGAMALYSAYTRSSTQYEQQSREYDSIKQTYQIQEGIYNPAKTRMANVMQGVGHAVAPVIGASAAIGVSSEPHETAIGISGIATGFDPSSVASEKTPTTNENIPWHPAQERKAGHSFAQIERARMQNRNLATREHSAG